MKTLRPLRRFLKYGLAALSTTLGAEQLLPSAEMVTWKDNYQLKMDLVKTLTKTWAKDTYINKLFIFQQCFKR